MEDLIKALTFNTGRIMVTGIKREQFEELFKTLKDKGFTNVHIVSDSNELLQLRHKAVCIAIIGDRVDTTAVNACFLNIPFNN